MAPHVLMVIFALYTGNAMAEEASTFKIEARIYQALASALDTGPTEQKLPGPDGWLQVVHQRLDDVDLRMDGQSLTWNGAPMPDDPRIIEVSAPTLVTNANEEARVIIGSEEPLQFMEAGGDGELVMKRYEPQTEADQIGLSLSMTPSVIPDMPGLISVDISLQHVWVQMREAIEGVNLDVGKPVLGRATAAGRAQARLGEWSCLRTPLASDGWMFLFVRLTHEDAQPVDLVADKDAKGLQLPTATSTTDQPPVRAESSGFIKNVEVGGSVRIRAEYRTGGR